MVAAVRSPVEFDSETSRVRAALVNAGGVSFLDAEEALAASRLIVAIADEVVDTAVGQAAFLTAVATA
jgi:hypothetical protein